ncbi:hypothetical protein [Methylobacterium persicinum]|uniref:Curli production assembly/transport component CsgF n=1 Tax=Methylobacterium persicinum TaxID=374426 RepID=A0ABU0HGG3_9HYPH|nr:hypothetical protein [Methylobacterium persicinum]MDQ0441409.1 hypothetical protein [Methylobacterium persicinum]
MTKLALTLVTVLSALPAAATVATAQPLPPGVFVPPGGFAIISRNNTGGDVSVTIPRGATGAETFTSNSAAGGNAGRPELAVPNGSAGGGGNSR